MQTIALLPSSKWEREATEHCCRVPALQECWQDTSIHATSIHASRGLGHSSQECFQQTKVMPGSTLPICFLQDRVSVPSAGEQHHIKPCGSRYQLVTRAGGRRESCDVNSALLFVSGSQMRPYRAGFQSLAWKWLKPDDGRARDHSSHCFCSERTGERGSSRGDKPVCFALDLSSHCNISLLL